jgi:hypothetical protein
MTLPNVGTVAASAGQQMLASLVRTFVPIVVAFLVDAFARIGVDLPSATAEQTVNALISAGIALLYYGVARWLELHKSSKFGWLLGYAKAAPLYVVPAGAVPAIVVDEQPAIVQPPADNDNV